MSESMVERVARALALADLDPESRRAVNLDAHMAHVRGHYGELARAAIEAMREPTKEMVVAGDDEKEMCIDSDYDSRAEESYTTIDSDLPARVFRAMIDAALNEHANAR